MRCFIAIDIDKKTRTNLADLQQKLAGEVDIRKGDVKWVNPDNIHLTLKFLGEIEDTQAVEACEIAEQVAARHNNFDIEIASVGTFGGKSARVVWAGVTQGANELIDLQKDLDNELAQAGHPKDQREFSAHLTLCRIGYPKAGAKLAEVCKGYKDYKVGSISADALCVYQSRLTPAGPVYTLLGSYKLA